MKENILRAGSTLEVLNFYKLGMNWRPSFRKAVPPSSSRN